MGLKVLIIGAGLGGLAAAVSVKSESPDHEILVLESAPELAEVGVSKSCTGRHSLM
jgi:salicylate hydroxylase